MPARRTYTVLPLVIPSPSAVRTPERNVGLRQPSVASLYPSRDRSFVLDQVSGYSCLKCLIDAIPRSLAGLDRVVNRNAEVRRDFDQLAVLRPNRG